MNNLQNSGKALVVGGSIAGMLTARVLSDYYDEVVIVDKDDFPARPEERSGVPHGYHPHRFTQRGASIIGRLFPEYEEDLRDQGAPSVLNKTVHNMNQYGTMNIQYPRNDFKFSRALLEWVLRNRIRSIPYIRLLPKHDGIRLLTTPDRMNVTGLSVRERGATGLEQTVHADLVVDTSGRSSKLSQWLEELGYEVPQPDLLKVELGYSTRRYQLPSRLKHLAEKWDTINIAGQPAHGTFAGILSFIENDVAEVLLYRPGGRFPPVNADEYEQAVAQLPSPILAEPIATPRGYRVPELFRRRYEKMQRWPSGLLVLGDAYCIYDPIFGQGMTVAAMEAELLEARLQEQRDDPQPNFEKRVLQDMQKAIEPAWWLNCANDLQWEGVEYAGAEPLKGIDLGRDYLDLFLKQATMQRNWKMYGLYWAVTSLTLSPREILNPDMIAAVLAYASNEEKRRLTEMLGAEENLDDAVLDRLLPHFEYFAP